jgi:hypothetical protein
MLEGDYMLEVEGFMYFNFGDEFLLCSFLRETCFLNHLSCKHTFVLNVCHFIHLSEPSLAQKSSLDPFDDFILTIGKLSFFLNYCLRLLSLI